MMDMREFTEKVKREIADFLPEEVRGNIEVDETTVVKMNDQKLHGLILREKGSDAAPTFYIDDMFSRYENGEDIGLMLSELAAHYGLTEAAEMRPPEVDLSWESVRDRLSVRLVEKQRNREFLMDKPYADVGNGLAVIADINMDGDERGEWRAAVTHSLLDQIGTDKETLFLAAMDDAVRNDPPVLTDMSQALFSPERENLLERGKPLEPSEMGAMYVLTTESANLGAAALFYPEVKDRAAETIGSGYYVLPSSTHEVILVPDTAGHDEKDLVEMVKQANRTVVEPKDILSDNVFHYDRESRDLFKVDPARDKADRVAEAR